VARWALLIREYDWASNPLGPPESWLQSLKIAVRIMLRDQLQLLEAHAGEIGDAAVPARLATTGGILALGRLREAIILPTELIAPLLQTETKLEIKIQRDMVRWTYVVTDTSDVGRQKNEILAVGYMLDLLRRFLGPRWTPPATVSGGSLLDRTITENMRCDLSVATEASVQFASTFLDAINVNGARSEFPMPENDVRNGRALPSVPNIWSISVC
jgi:hypothetical protein